MIASLWERHIAINVFVRKERMIRARLRSCLWHSTARARCRPLAGATFRALSLLARHMNDAPTSQLRLAAVTVMTIADLTLRRAGERAAIHGRLVQLGLSVRHQRKRVGALFERGQHIRDLSHERRLDGRRQQPDDRQPTAASASPATPSPRRRARRSPGPMGRPAGPQITAHWGTFMRALPSGAAVLGPAKRPVLRPDRLRHQQLPDHLHRPTRHNPPRATGHLRSRTCSPGAAMHSHVLEVTIDDPQPPSISLSGRMVSGQWVSGTAGHVPDVQVEGIGQQRDPGDRGDARDAAPELSPTAATGR